MSPNRGSVDTILEALQERAKELHCLYRVHEICSRQDVSLDEVFREVVTIVPRGWQFPGECFARITVDGAVYEPPGAVSTEWTQSSPIRVQGEVVGTVEVFYTEAMPLSDEGPFLKEERKLIDTIAERLGQLLLHRKLLSTAQNWQSAMEGLASRPRGDWWVIIDFLRKTDHQLLVRISRRMINYLCWNGVAEAQDLLPRFTEGEGQDRNEKLGDENRPLERQSMNSLLAIAEETFKIAPAHLSPEEILSCIQKWIKDDRSGFLIEAVENQGSSLTELTQALERYHHFALDDKELSRSIQVELRVSLARRFLTDQLDFIRVARDYIEVSDFHDLARHVICPPKGHGRVGGKSAGLFLATHIIRKSPEFAAMLGEIRIPKTWYVTSDGVLNFIEYNHLEDLYNRKYLEIEQVRREYPHIIQIFKNSHFSPEIVKGLSLALDDFEDRPLIVRSSSLLEDRVGAAFSGKYKSLFLANQGTKAERMNALMDAIAEVYASIFGPDPIAYRGERGLLDVHEEMGILMQEVVGNRVGQYYFPTFAGVAFSNNEFRWSARIARDDGLLRLVPGLGTRAVDRVGDDYPVLIAPGKPGLRANVTPDEVVRYSPKMIDVIDLETRQFTTVDLAKVLSEHGGEIPGIRQLVSVCDEGEIHRPYLLEWESKRSDFIVTFEGLVSDTPFVSRMKALLKLLAEKMGGPVDIEFASDGRDFYLLQCRPQSFSEEAAAAPIPRDVAPEKVVFTARKFVSNGRMPDVTHIVYVEPEAYAATPDLATYRRIGRAIGRLNKLLPKRQFVLMGPGRWGSRGDVRLGVSVTYSDISNTACLIEIARKRGNYVPDLSFGTHFFQDLVEASIRYLPLFPDDPEVVFNEVFLRETRSVFSELLPDYADLADTIRVIDVPRATGGLVLRILMNADADESIGFLARPGAASEMATERRWSVEPVVSEEHSRWRMRMAERIAAEIEPERFGIKGLYVFGSTKNGTAGPGSDINVLVRFEGTEEQRKNLLLWLEGWSVCLAEMNSLRTGVVLDRLLDVVIVTDDDIERQLGFASKIDAITDPARPLVLGKACGTVPPVS